MIEKRYSEEARAIASAQARTSYVFACALAIPRASETTIARNDVVAETNYLIFIHFLLFLLIDKIVLQLLCQKFERKGVRLC